MKLLLSVTAIMALALSCHGDYSRWTLERTQIEARATDGLQKADLTGDGMYELIVGADDSTVRWYRIDGDGRWESHLVQSGFAEIEGVDAADFDGDGRNEIVALDQDAGKVFIIKSDTDCPTGSWRKLVIDDSAPMAQSSFITDISGNGKPDIVYTYDGHSDGVGGIYWLENMGGAVLDPENWEKHTILQINGGHGIHDEWITIEGRKGIVASTRLQWNSDAVPEVFWLEKPVNDPREPWKRHTIVAEHSRKIAVADFSGNGDPADVFTIRTDYGRGIYWYEHLGGMEWTEHVVTDRGRYRTVSAHDITGNGTPEVIVSERGGDNSLLIYAKIDGSYELVARKAYAKTDDRILYYDVTGDGRSELVTTSDWNTFDYWRVNWDDSETKSEYSENLQPVVLGYGEGLFEVGELLHEDNFENLDNWVLQIQPHSGDHQPRVVASDNTLDSYVPRSGATIWFAHKLEGPIAVTYQVRAPKRREGSAAVPRDINVFWHASDPSSPADVLTNPRYNGSFGRYHSMNGYYASMGGRDNTTTRFRRYPRQTGRASVPHIALSDHDRDPDYMIDPERTHTVQVVAFDDVIQFIVDGKLFYQIRDGDIVSVASGDRSEMPNTADIFPVHTAGWFGFRMVRTHHIYSNFRVYRLRGLVGR